MVRCFGSLSLDSDFILVCQICQKIELFQVNLIRDGMLGFRLKLVCGKFTLILEIEIVID